MSAILHSYVYPPISRIWRLVVTGPTKSTQYHNYSMCALSWHAWIAKTTTAVNVVLHCTGLPAPDNLYKIYMSGPCRSN